MDPIDAAVAAANGNGTDKPGPAVRMRRYQVQLPSTGRPAILVVPADASDAEVAELAGFLLTEGLAQARAERSKGNIAVVRSVLPKSLRS